MNIVGFMATDLQKKQSISRFLPAVAEVLGTWLLVFLLVIIQWTLSCPPREERRSPGEMGFTFTKRLLCARHVVLHQEDSESLVKNPQERKSLE